LFFVPFGVDLTVALVSKLLFKVAVPYGGGSARSGIGVKLLYVVKPQRKIQLLASLLQRFATSEYHRHRSIHHPISFYF
jgi:hypothetical protein